jgi:F-type H+-transporting ATPase subunit c
MEAEAAKFLGAGLACLGMGLAGIGVGNIFGDDKPPGHQG